MSEHTTITHKTDKKAGALLCKLIVTSVSVVSILTLFCMYCSIEEMCKYIEVVGSQSLHCERRKQRERENVER